MTAGRSRAPTHLRFVFAAMISSGVAGIISCSAMVGRDLALAQQFGAGSSVDSYIISYTFVMFVASVLANSISPALMPTYIRARERWGDAAAYALARRSMAVIFIGTACVALLVATQTKHVLAFIGSNLSPPGRAIAQETMAWMLGMLPVQGATAVLTVIAHARGKFARPGLAPALSPIAALVALIASGGRSGVGVVAVGTMLGSVAQFAVFVPEWRRIVCGERVTADSGAWWEVVRQYWPVVAGAIFLSATPLIDQSMAASMAEGSVSTLSYGQKLVSLILNIGSLVLSNAILPHLSEMAARKDWTGIQKSIRTFWTLVVALSFPATCVLFFFSEPIAVLIYQRGALSAAEAVQIGHVQGLLLLQLPFYLGGILSVRLISALNANILLMYGTVLSVVLKVVFNASLMRWLGIAGIALSTSLVYACSCGYLTIAAAHLLGRRARSVANYAIANS